MEKSTTKAINMPENISVLQGSELKVACDESAPAFSPIRLSSGNKLGKPAGRASGDKKGSGFLRLRNKKVRAQ